MLSCMSEELGGKKAHVDELWDRELLSYTTGGEHRAAFGEYVVVLDNNYLAIDNSDSETSLTGHLEVLVSKPFLEPECRRRSSQTTPDNNDFCSIRKHFIVKSSMFHVSNWMSPFERIFSSLQSRHLRHCFTTSANSPLGIFFSIS